MSLKSGHFRLPIGCSCSVISGTQIPACTLLLLEGQHRRSLWGSVTARIRVFASAENTPLQLPSDVRKIGIAHVLRGLAALSVMIVHFGYVLAPRRLPWRT